MPLNVNMMKAGSELSKTIGEVEKSMDQIYKQNDVRSTLKPFYFIGLLWL